MDDREQHLPNQTSSNVSDALLRPQDITQTEQRVNNADKSANCRLRNGLNDHCLCKIFEFLEFSDLIQLCEVDEYFENLIVNYVISKTWVDFTKWIPWTWSKGEIFLTFGKTMRKMKISEKMGNFLHFLCSVIHYCLIGRLTNLELQFHSISAPTVIMEQSMPYFANLRQLVLIGINHGETNNTFLAAISASATNLTHLTLDGMSVSGDWLLVNGMQNLKELRIHTSKYQSMNIQTADLSKFLRNKSKLQLFSYIGRVDIRSVIDMLTTHCTQLKTLVYFLSNSVHRRDLAIITDQMKRENNFVRQLNGVTTVGLTSYTNCGSDLYFPLIELAARNQVETLKILIVRRITVTLLAKNRMHYSQEKFASFTCLKSVELQMISNSPYQRGLNSEFICEFISKLTNIQKFTVISDTPMRDIHQIIDLAPNLNQLNIAHIVYGLMESSIATEIQKIVESIRKRRESQISTGQQNPLPFNLIVNKQQKQELENYKDMMFILKIFDA